MQLAYVWFILLMFGLCVHCMHDCIVHIFCTQSWHIIARNLYANCLYATCLCFVYAFITRVHSAHKAWHIIACNLNASCLHAICIHFACESFHLKSAAFSHPPISTILDFALEFITGWFGYLMKEFQVIACNSN